MRTILITVLSVLAFSSPLLAADFRFENFTQLAEMHAYLNDTYNVGDDRETVRQVFMDQGGATLIEHPNEAGVEKYIYDINLCNYYVWRWNISADYDDEGGLEQIYLNGNPVLADGTPLRKVSAKAPEGKEAKILKGQRPRPEAYKGEKSLAFLMLDSDGDLKTLHDQAAIGSGPSRADPMDMRRLNMYKEVDPWRSIFDHDEAAYMADYQGNCAQVDAFYSGANKPKDSLNSGIVVDRVMEGADLPKD